MFEPHDLDDLTPAAALDAVFDDIHRYPIPPENGTGFFTAVRRIDLITHLISRFSNDALYHLEENPQDAPAARPTVEALTAACLALTQALTHYTQALQDLTALHLQTPPSQHSTAALLAGIERRGSLHRHLHAAHTALGHADTTLAPLIGDRPAAPHAAHAKAAPPHRSALEHRAR